MALGSSSFGRLLQSSDNFHTAGETSQITPSMESPIFTSANNTETAGSVAWGGFDICELSTTTVVDYTAYSSAPVETAGSIASSNISGGISSVISASTSCASVSAAVSCTSSSGTSCSYSC